MATAGQMLIATGTKACASYAMSGDATLGAAGALTLAGNSLTALKALTPAANKMLYFTGAATATTADITAAGLALLDDATAAAQRTTLGLDSMAVQASTAISVTGGTLGGVDITVGSGKSLTISSGTLTLADSQVGWAKVSKTSSSLADLATRAATALTASNTDVLLGRVSAGSGAVEEVTFSDFAQTLMDDANAAAARTTLGLDSMATQAASAVAITGGTLATMTSIEAKASSASSIYMKAWNTNAGDVTAFAAMTVAMDDAGGIVSLAIWATGRSYTTIGNLAGKGILSSGSVTDALVIASPKAASSIQLLIGGYVAANEMCRIGASGLAIGTTSWGTAQAGTQLLAMETGTPPDVAPAVDSFLMYSADQVAGNACPHFRTENNALVKLYQAAHVTDASTAAAVTDPGDAPADADALRDDLVTNTIPSVEAALNALGTKINVILVTLENLGLHATV